MNDKRLTFNATLLNILENGNVYFQPPASLLMKYPAIRYSVSKLYTKRANDKIYGKMTAYEVIVIDKNPDSEIPDKILNLPYCSFDRQYIADNLNHFVFTVYI